MLAAEFGPGDVGVVDRGPDAELKFERKIVH
jgi:hypothetical protein